MFLSLIIDTSNYESFLKFGDAVKFSKCNRRFVKYLCRSFASLVPNFCRDELQLSTL